MIEHSIQTRVRYGETDQMGYVYYGIYAQYFEMGRVEWLRNIGSSYKSMEKNKVMLPVVNMNVDYIRPAKYDDLLTIKTSIKKVPSAKIEFDFEIFNEKNILLTKGYTCLVFVDMVKNKPTKCPKYLLDKIIPMFDK